jgi:predicted  nucleic acid-binding Zn-ribbon protein
MLKEHQSLRRDMSGWLQDRKVILKQIDADKYKVYKKIKAQKNGLAVARLNGESCEVCRVEQYLTIISQVRQHNQLVFCHNCGRILVDI